MQNIYFVMQRSHNKNSRRLQFLLIGVLSMFLSTQTWAQLTLTVTVDQGNSTTTCTDIFGAPDPLWRVNVGGASWSTYSNNNGNGCHSTYPNDQYAITVDCNEDLPAMLEVCFRSFENDGFGCNLAETCLVEECQDIVVPPIGWSENHTITIPAGMDSGGSVDFTIELSGTSVASSNDGICDAEDLGILPLGGKVGDMTAGGFNNICSSNINDVNPADDGAWENEQGVWVAFTTSATPGHELIIEALNDPMNIGNVMNIQLALYRSDDGTCSGNLELLESSFATGIFDESLFYECPEANMTYYILVDGNFFSDETEGYFGIEVRDAGGESGGDRRCDALDMGMVPVGGSVSATNQSNHCADNITDPNPSAFIGQQSVWYNFQAPPSGHVIIDAVSSLDDPIGLQLALYRSFNDMCNGFFFEVESVFTSADLDESLNIQCLTPGNNYWILIDGSGSFTDGIFDLSIEDGGIYPPMVTVDTTICFGTSIAVGTATYSETDTYTAVVQLSNGCDSTIITNLTVADSLDAAAEQIQLASSMTNADGVVSVDVTGGVAPFTYLWDTGATTQTVNGLSTDTYCVTVTDSIGCVAEGCILLEFSTIAINAVASTLLCNGDNDGAVTFSVQDGVAPYSYTYSNVNLTVTGTGVLNSDLEEATFDGLSAGSYLILVEDVTGTTTFTSVVIDEPAEITTTINPVICFGDSIQIGNMFYQTQGPINEILTAINGCDSIVTGMLSVLPDPSFAINAVLCVGDSVIVGTSIYSENGIYQDTFPASTGCDSIVTTTVFVLDEITLEINATVLPTGYSLSDGEALVNVTGGAGGFTFVWSTGETTQNITNVTGGEEYCVTVTDGNGCSAETCDTILYVPNIAFATTDSLDCNGATDGVIDLTVQNGLGAYYYYWENETTGQAFNGIIMGNSGTDQITDLQAGHYFITVTDAFVTTEFELDILEPNPLSILPVVFPTANLCQNECNASIDIEAIGGTPPYTYAWSGGLDPVANPTDICAGTYQLTITDANGCTFTFAEEIQDGPVFSAEITEVVAISCGGESDGILNVSATGGFSPVYAYEWNNGITDSTGYALVAGNYVVTVFDGVGCTTTSSFNLPEPTPVTFDVVVNDVNCWEGESSGSILLENVSGGSAPYQYSFAGEAPTVDSTFGQLGAGSYQVNVQDANGCEVSTNAIVSFPAMVNLDLGGDQLIYLGESVSLEPTFSSNNALITWNLDSCQNCPTIELQPLESDNYEVTVQDTITGCSETVNVWVNVSRERRVFIPNAFSPNEDGVNDLFTIFGDEKSIVNINSLQIFDRWGAKLFEASDLMPNIESEGWDGFFNGKKMGVGVFIYFAEIEFIDGRTEIFKGDVTLTR